MSKKTLLSALLISSFSFLSISAAADLKDANTAPQPGAEQTMMKFTSNSKKAEQRILAISDQTCPTFPFARAAENNADQIVIKSSVLTAIDPWFFQGNTSLKKVSFEGSTISLAPFEGHTFLAGCDAIEAVSFKGTTGVDLATFLEQHASPTLLQRILDRKCKLIIDMADTGITMANFAKDGVYTQEAIHLLIRSSRFIEQIAKEKAAAPAQKGWVSTLTLGLFGQ
jgi:hypothetical protein